MNDAVTTTTPHPLQIYADAVKQGVSADTLRQIFELAKDYEQHEAAKLYAAAIAAFQLECPMVFKGREVHDRSGKLMYTFANYEDIKRVTKPLEAKHGITVSFTITRTEGRMDGSMRIRVGNYFEDKTGTMTVPKGMNTNAAQDDIQATSYFKRNLYCIGLDIVTSDSDNDGAGLYQKIGPDEIKHINELIEDCEKAGCPVDYKKFLDWLQVDDLSQIAAAKFTDIVADLRRKAKGGKK